MTARLFLAILVFLMNYPICKRSSLRSQCRMRLFLWFSNTLKECQIVMIILFLGEIRAAMSEGQGTPSLISQSSSEGIIFQLSSALWTMALVLNFNVWAKPLLFVDKINFFLIVILHLLSFYQTKRCEPPFYVDWNIHKKKLVSFILFIRFEI